MNLIHVFQLPQECVNQAYLDPRVWGSASEGACRKVIHHSSRPSPCSCCPDRGLEHDGPATISFQKCILLQHLDVPHW